MYVFVQVLFILLLPAFCDFIHVYACFIDTVSYLYVIYSQES